MIFLRFNGFHLQNCSHRIREMPARVIVREQNEAASSHGLTFSTAAFWLFSKQQDLIVQVDVDQATGEVIVPKTYQSCPKRMAIEDPRDMSRRILSPSRLALLTSEHYPKFAELCYGETLTKKNFDDHARALMSNGKKFGREWMTPTKRRWDIKDQSIAECLEDYLRDHGDHFGMWTDNHHQEAADETVKKMIQVLETQPRQFSNVIDPSVLSVRQRGIKRQIELNKKMTEAKLKKAIPQVVGFIN